MTEGGVTEECNAGVEENIDECHFLCQQIFILEIHTYTRASAFLREEGQVHNSLSCRLINELIQYTHRRVIRNSAY